MPSVLERRGPPAIRSFLTTHVGDGARGLFLVAVCAAAAAASPSSANEIEGEPVVIPASASASAQPAAAARYRNNDENDWKFLVSINPWFLFMNGAITIRDDTVPISVDFGSLWNHLHMAMMADVDVQKGDFGFFSDISWARLWNRQQEIVGPPFDMRERTIKTDLDWALFDFGLYYEALELNLGSGPLPPRLRLQPYIGGRYQYFGTEVQIREQGRPDRLITPVSHTAAPILGLRGFLDINEHWNVTLVGDGGGFGVDGMEKTWQAELAAGYRLRFKRFPSWDFNVLVGYKGVGVDIENGAKPIEGDLIYHGPVLKIGLEF